MTDVKNLIKRLETEISFIDESDMNHTDVDSEVGVVITGNDAKLFIELLKQKDVN